MNLGIVCVAGGSGVRFGGDKLAEWIAGATVLEHSLRALSSAFPGAPLVVVLPEDRQSHWAERLAMDFAHARVVAGGPRRQDSVQNGVRAALESPCELVAVHDGARPLLHRDDFHAVVDAASGMAGAVLCRRVSDTVKRVSDGGEVLETIDRASLRLIQTPQVFSPSALEEAWAQGDFEVEWTDEAALLESLGMAVQTCVADHPNLKLTTMEDLVVIEALMKRRLQ